MKEKLERICGIIGINREILKKIYKDQGNISKFKKKYFYSSFSFESQDSEKTDYLAELTYKIAERTLGQPQ